MAPRVTTTRLWCRVSGDTPEHIFSVKISLEDYVDDLRKEIKKEKPVLFANTDADDIRLYKLNAPVAMNEPLPNPLEDGQAEELKEPGRKISSYFSDVPDGKLHVVILRPGSESPESLLHQKAWGHPWPRHKGTILRTDLTSSDADAMDIDQDDPSAPVAVGIIDIPEKFEYVCLDDVNQVSGALGVASDVMDILVVRHEYEDLLKMLTGIPPSDNRRTIGIVVTGQPGIGKTAFLLYLLLHRLEKKLPTAVQFERGRYVIFDGKGAEVINSETRDERLAECWALADSNANLTLPCPPFQSQARLVIQASSPKPERWKEWLKQRGGPLVITELPTKAEIVAIAKELGYDPSSAISAFQTWGPSTRTILAILKTPNDSDVLQAQAEASAKEILEGPSPYASGAGRVPDSKGSSILFVRPYRRSGLKSSSSTGVSFIPTQHLHSIFGEVSTDVSNAQAFNLFKALSSHSLTRGEAGWMYEQHVHKALSQQAEPLRIFQLDSPAIREMQPSTNLIPGTAACLNKVRHGDHFYWMPSVINFPGVDGVLGDGHDNVYFIQATIAEKHSSPIKGLEKLWKDIGTGRLEHCKWHFVVVGDHELNVDSFLKTCSKDLNGTTFGRPKKRVEVWGCVFTPKG